MSSNPSKQKRHSHHSDLAQSQLLPARPNPSSEHPSSPVPQDQASTTTSSPSTPNEEDAPNDLPLSMSTSLLLASPSLPTDARTALTQLTLDPPDLKCSIRFHALPSAPELQKKVFKISASSKFGSVVSFLRKKLYGKIVQGEGGRGGGQGLFCYVNSVFAPGLDEGVGNLWRCFKVEGHLNVGYSITPAFG